jgi:glycerophosphoryl diester phosphodiesterase
MAAYRKAREAGAPGIELDVHISAPAAGNNGELIVAHDDTFIRTAPGDANGNGRTIEELSLAEIRTIDVGSFFSPAFSGERPPLLAEVLEEFCPDMYIDIELKSHKITRDPLPRLVAETLKRLGPKIDGAVTVSSFNPFCLRAFKGYNPRIPTAVIWCDAPEVPRIFRRGFGRFIARSDYVKPVHLQVNRSCCSRMAKERRPLVPWTIDDPALAEKMLSLGCEGIISNRPQDMLQLIRTFSHG